MLKRPFLLGYALLVCALAHGQDPTVIKGYVRMRKQFKVASTSTQEQLNAVVQPQVVEIAGTAKGTFKVGEQESLLLECGGGENLMIEANTLPGWLQGGEAKVRVLAEVSRTDASAGLKAKLLGVCQESGLSEIEAQEKAKADKIAKARGSGRTKVASRSGNPTYLRTAAQHNLPTSAVMPAYSAFIRRWNSRLTRAQADEIATCVIGFGLQRGVDPRLLMAVLMTESDFNPRTVSKAGAMGLGQLMPVNMQELGLNNAFDTVQNLYGTATLIRQHIDKYRAKTNNEYDALVLALAGYNAGDGAVKKYGGVPPYRETQNYVRKVIRYYEQLIGERISPG